MTHIILIRNKNMTKEEINYAVNRVAWVIGLMFLTFVMFNIYSMIGHAFSVKNTTLAIIDLENEDIDIFTIKYLMQNKTVDDIDYFVYKMDIEKIRDNVKVK